MGEDDKYLLAIQRIISMAVRAETKRCAQLAVDTAKERRAAGDPEGAQAIWDLAKEIRGW